jgi:hypothetical protein
MNIPTRQEFAAAFAGVRGLLKLDARAFATFDASHDGFWKSFWAAAILAPFAAAMVARQAMEAPPESPWRFVAFQIIGYAVSWLAYPLAMVRISAMLGRSDRYFAYMVPYNWFQLVDIVFQGPLLVLALAGILPQQVEALLTLVVLGAELGYGWYIAKNALRVSGGTAAALVVIDQLISILIYRLTYGLP